MERINIENVEQIAERYFEQIKQSDKPVVVVSTGAGVSAESGLKTFRDNNGLWENHDVTRVATPEAWARDPELVSRFYNMRREQLGEVEPNAAHLALKKLEKKYLVFIVTQNVDDLHERAGSEHIIHLHGELRKVCGSKNKALVYDAGYRAVELGEQCEEGSQLRPWVVWFGEEVPNITLGNFLARQADVFLIIGTSMAVYPAAGMLHHVPEDALKIVVDKQLPTVPGGMKNLVAVEKPASEGVPEVVDLLLDKA